MNRNIKSRNDTSKFNIRKSHRLRFNNLNKILHTSIALIGMLIIFSNFSFAQEVTQDWVSRFNGPGNGQDDAYAITTDNMGNVYVTGRAWVSINNRYDYATIKYDPNGQLLWQKFYNGPASSDDYARAITVDNDGNVYVTGESAGSLSDIATIKYNSTGDELWAVRYNGQFYGMDKGKDIAVDVHGNVYVTGFTKGAGMNALEHDYITIKYNSNGVELWAARYNGTANSDDEAVALRIDESGNVYVTGSSIGVGISYDIVTIKYNSAGDEVWVIRYNGLANQYDGASGIALDSQGNLYVAGSTIGVDGYSDFVVIKYDTSGVEQWVVKYDGPGNHNDNAVGVEVDQLGNVYVSGTSNNSNTASSRDYATVKYNPHGELQWVSRYDGPGNNEDFVIDFKVDAAGNVYVTGSSRASGNLDSDDYATVKYNTHGIEQWVERYNGTGNSTDLAHALTLDNSGNVYITGSSLGVGSGFDYATIKYSQESLSLSEFNLLLPIDSDTVMTIALSEEEFSFTWQQSGSNTTYKLILDTTGSSGLITIPISTNSFQTTLGFLDSILSSYGVLESEVLTFQWDVWAYTEIDGVEIDSLKAANGPRSITLIRSELESDAGVSSIVSPLEGQLLNSNGSNVSAYIKNFGQTSLSNVEVYYDVNLDTPIGPVVLPGPIEPGDSALVVFTGANQLSHEFGINVSVRVYTSIDGDADNTNDSATVNAQLTIPISSFPFLETWDSPVFWTYAGSTNLWVMQTAVNPSGVAGDPAMRANFYTFAVGSQLMRSPVVDLTTLTNPVLSFYVAYTTFLADPGNDVIQIFISTNGGINYEPAEYEKSWNSTPSLATVPPQNPSFVPGSSNHWRHEIVDLSAYAGQEIVIGFNAITGYGNFAWIDNIKISDVSNISIIPVNSPGLYGVLENDEAQINFTSLRPDFGNVTTGKEKRSIFDSKNLDLKVSYLNKNVIAESIEERSANFGNNNANVSPDASSGFLTISRVDDFPVGPNTFAQNLTATTLSGAIFTPDVVANRYWEIAFSGDDYSSSATYDIIINISTQVGIVDPDRLYIMKRVDQNSPWVCHSTVTEYEMGLPVRLVATGLQGFSQFGIGAEDGTLPVDLVFFNAMVDKNNVTLNWTTAWEENNMRFDVQRRAIILNPTQSGEESTWNTIGSVTGSGTTQEQKSYSYIDRNLVTGKYEYRLVQVDFDGNSTADHSLTSQVEVGIPNEFSLSQNYPNPFNPVTKIDFQIPIEGMTKLVIYDMSGREVATLVNEVLTPGYYSYTFNGANLSSGVYLYRLLTNNNVITKRAVLVK